MYLGPQRRKTIRFVCPISILPRNRRSARPRALKLAPLRAARCLLSSYSHKVLYVNEFSSVTSVAWNQQSDNYIMVGVQAGDIYLVDKRETNNFVTVFTCFDAPVSRIAFKDSSEFAVCGETKEVLVLSCEDTCLETIYKYDEHKDHVKDIKWHNSTLYSCGFGKCLLKHGMEE
ncbi:unnamed protein product [Acanthoscelides obtectus]|uniref:Uncharacterized protein n=1 Tax=Acanthoscelides obtectus TaxID=200917 RepID=A0A9P0KGC4_ACAOB|nr:unnamed protein product [Acanthoscelides obtectus]CAK1640035.1 hypothetical protein AOBTE_LOCUS11518 [Acanthoscelides obtectus]